MTALLVDSDKLAATVSSPSRKIAVASSTGCVVDIQFYMCCQEHDISVLRLARHISYHLWS